MSVSRWDWTVANPPKNREDHFAYVLYDASAEQVRRAYRALTTKGPVSDMSAKVWNDLCGKILDINKEWQTNNYFGYTYPLVWVFTGDPNDYAYNDYETLKAIAGRLEADCMNVAAGALFTEKPKPWVKELGREKLRKGDVVKGEYILWLADTVNHWCDLIPIWYGFSAAFYHTLTVQTLQPYSMPIFPILLDMQIVDRIASLTWQAYPFSLKSSFQYSSRKAYIAEASAMPFSSPINFSSLKIHCGVWTNNMMIVIPEGIFFHYADKASSCIRIPLVLRWNSSFRNGDTVSAFANDHLALISGLLPIQHSGVALLNAAGITELGEQRGAYFHNSAGKLIIRRAIHFSAYNAYHFDASVVMSHEGVELLDMAESILRILDRLEMERRDAVLLTQNGRLDVTTGENRIEAPTVQDMENSGVIAFGSNPVELPNGMGANVALQTERILVSGDDQIDTAKATEVRANDIQLQNIQGGGELTFANEQSMQIRVGSFAVRGGASELSDAVADSIAHDGTFGTGSSIFLQETSTIELQGEETAYIRSQAKLQKDSAYEAESDSFIYTLADAQIQPSQEAGLEADVYAATMKAKAEVVGLRFARLVAEANISTVERSVLEIVIRRLLASDALISTTEYGTVLARLMHFLESYIENSTRADGTAVSTIPAHLRANAKTQPAASAYLDKNYSQSDGSAHEEKVLTATDAIVSAVASGMSMNAVEIMTTLYEAVTELMAPKILDSTNITSIRSETTVVMAKSELIFASDHEDALISDLDTTLAHDVERHLIF